MKRVVHGKKGDDVCSMSHVFKDRRKAYYHGKYRREIFSIVVLLAFVSMLFIQ